MSAKKPKKTASDTRRRSKANLSVQPLDENEDSCNLETFETKQLCEVGHDPYGVRAVESLQLVRTSQERPSSSSPQQSPDFDDVMRDYRQKFPIVRSVDEIKIDNRPRLSAVEMEGLAENAAKIQAFVIGFDELDGLALELTASKTLTKTICWQLDRTAHELTAFMKRDRHETPDSKFALIHRILQTNRLTVDQLHDFYRMKWRRRCEKLTTQLANDNGTNEAASSQSIDSPDESHQNKQTPIRSATRRKRKRTAD